MNPPPRALRAIFFDLDGTCINSDDIHYEAYRDTILELVPTFNGGEPITREFYSSQMTGKQNPQLVADILPELDLDAQTALWKRKEERYEAVIAQGVEPITGLVPLLRMCGEKLPHYIVTNAPRGPHEKTMKAIGITRFFDPAHIVLAEDCEFPKPHPAPYLHALGLAGVEAADAIVFEDSPTGTSAASKAGIFTIGIRTSQTDETLRAAGASLTIEDYTDPVLLNLIEGWTGMCPVPEK